MQKSTDQGETMKRKRIWRGIHWWMKKRGVTPGELADQTNVLLSLIQAGLKGEPMPVSLYLRRFALALALTSGRGGRFYEDETTDNLSDEEIERLFIDEPDDDQPNLWSD